MTTILLALPNGAYPHGGGLDDLGCHHDRHAGEYHCHRGDLAGRSFASKAEAVLALGDKVPPNRPGSTTPSVRPSSILTGRASVVDGDTLDIHGKRIRLHGIDAPESDQTCRRDSETWRCGQQAALALADKIGQQPVRCEEKDRDLYGRIVAKCFVGSQDLSEWLAREGWAVAYVYYSYEYTRAEASAKSNRRGIWAGEFDYPWEWRESKRRDAARDDAGDCRIKGNISRKGVRIYHVPGGRWYDRTHIDTAKGERWFCTETEARAAGWRRSKR